MTAMSSQIVPIHDYEGFAAMRRTGRLAALLLDYITPVVVPGVSTGELDRLCAAYTERAGATSAPLNYRGFPKSICTSVNHVVCHGIPNDDKSLQRGDIVNLDVTVLLEGWYGDSSRMYMVGDRLSVKARNLVRVTYECLERGIAQVRPGATLGDIGAAIQQHAEANRFSVVRDFCGHGIGRVFHDEPQVLHYGKPGDGLTLQEGMIFTIEPMINAGGAAVQVLQDKWTAVTQDKSLSAQFEHTVGVTADGVEVFTASPRGWTQPPYT